MEWLDEFEQEARMLEMLQGATDWLGSSEIEEATQLCQWGVFGSAMKLLVMGNAVCLGSCEGSWLNFAESEAELSFRLARDTSELVETARMVDRQIAYLCRIRNGIDVARTSLPAPTDTAG